jgi:hypothetical protein
MASVEELIVKITAENSDLKNKMSESGKSVDKFGGMVSKLGPMIAGALSVGAVVAFGKASFAAFESQEKANRRLMFALRGNKDAFTELTIQASRLQSETGVDEESIMQIQMLGSQSGKTTDEIKKLIEASLGLSAATGMDLQGAYMMLNNTLNGSAGRLTRIDADFEKLTKTQLENGSAIQLAIDKYKGLAQESATAISKLSANWGEFQEGVGQVMYPAVTALTEYLNNVVTIMNAPEMEGTLLPHFKKLAIFMNVDLSRAWADYYRKIDETERRSQELAITTFKGMSLISQQWQTVKKTVSNTAMTFDELYKEMKKTTDAKQLGAFDLLNTKISETETKIKDVLATGGIVSPQMYADLQAYRKQVEDLNNTLANYGRQNITGRMTLITTPKEIKQEAGQKEIKQEAGQKDEYKLRLDADKKYYDSVVLMEEEAATRKMMIAKYENESRLAVSSNMLGAMASLFGEETAAYKLFASGKAVIDTYLAANAAYAALAGIPVVGPALGAAAAGMAITAGLANLAKINGIGMAEGGIVPPGFPNDSYGPVFLTSGERVTPPGKLPNGGKTEVFGRLRAGDIYLSNKRGAYLMDRRG